MLRGILREQHLNPFTDEGGPIETVSERSVYTHRIIGCNCYHSYTYSNSISGVCASTGKCTARKLPEQSKTDWFGTHAICARFR